MGMLSKFKSRLYSARLKPTSSAEESSNSHVTSEEVSEEKPESANKPHDKW